MSGAGGRLRVVLDVAEGRVRAAEIVSTWPTEAARAFVGRPAADMTALIGNVYSLCGRAQTIAALSAVEAAMGLSAPPAGVAARDALRLAEMFTQTAMRLSLYWPRALGLVPDPGLVRRALHAEQVIEREMMGEGWARPGSGALAPSPAVDKVIDRVTEAADTFVQGCGLRSELERRDLCSFGALPDGLSAEEGPLSRNWDQEPVKKTRARHDAGLAARLEASLAELARLPRQMLAVAKAAEPTPPRTALLGTGQGRAEVETARGPLRHMVTVKDGIVTACRIDAPTERNFRPGGPVTAGLIGAPEDRLALAAKLHVLAIDPCVEFQVEMRHA